MRVQWVRWAAGVPHTCSGCSMVHMHMQCTGTCSRTCNAHAQAHAHAHASLRSPWKRASRSDQSHASIASLNTPGSAPTQLGCIAVSVRYAAGMPELSVAGPSRRPAQACPSRPARDVKRAAASSSAGARRCSAPWDMIRPASWCVTAASAGHNREASCRASGPRVSTVHRMGMWQRQRGQHGAAWLSLEGARILQHERVQGDRVQGDRAQREATCSSLTPSGASAKAPSATYASASCGCKVIARRAASSAASSEAPVFSRCTACIHTRRPTRREYAPRPRAMDRQHSALGAPSCAHGST